MTDNPPIPPASPGFVSANEPPAPPSPEPTPGPSGPPPVGMPPGYPPPPQGYPQYHAYYPPQPPLNTYAILGLILGVMVFPPLGIYFGGKAKQQIAVSGERGIELATASVVVGWVLTVLLGLFFLLWCGLAVIMMGGFLSTAHTG